MNSSSTARGAVRAMLAHAAGRQQQRRAAGRLMAARTTTATAPMSTSSPSSRDPPSEQEMTEMLKRYAAYAPTPVSMQDFVNFGRTSTIETSFNFLRHEVPVRIANIMKEIQFLPPELKATKGCQLIKDQYSRTFVEVLAFADSDEADPEVQKEFTERLRSITRRHMDTVVTMAQAVLEVKSKYTSQGTVKMPRFQWNIQYFLDRLYTTRISTRMLINQHNLCFGDTLLNGNGNGNGGNGKNVHESSTGQVGAINADMKVLPIVERAFEDARFLSEQVYMASPELLIRSHDLTAEDAKVAWGGPDQEAQLEMSRDPIETTYVPSHMHHILFELFKNAMRATIEHHGEHCSALPPIKVTVIKSRDDLSIRVSDRGGGIPRRNIHRAFHYLYTTAPEPVLSAEDEDDLRPSGMDAGGSVPMAGYGFGLPLSRIYARYFDGDLALTSMDGFGSSACLCLHTEAKSAKERLPVFHSKSTSKIYDANQAPEDWTGSQNNDTKVT